MGITNSVKSLQVPPINFVPITSIMTIGGAGNMAAILLKSLYLKNYSSNVHDFGGGIRFFVTFEGGVSDSFDFQRGASQILHPPAADLPCSTIWSYLVRPNVSNTIL
jgi:hypothetical protein